MRNGRVWPRGVAPTPTEAIKTPIRLCFSTRISRARIRIKHQYQNFDKKDNKPYGTYVEVKGYYVNNSKNNPSYGNITYRFMLGQNVTDDFNATRNTHYKLTLVFNNDANDPDWHIEFGYKPNPPQIVTHDVYISYLYNRSTDIPVKVYFDKNIVVIWRRSRPGLYAIRGNMTMMRRAGCRHIRSAAIFTLVSIGRIPI